MRQPRCSATPAWGLALLAAAALPLLPHGARAQERPRQLRILFSDDPDKPRNARRDLLLRPNVEQRFYLYVENQGDKAVDATVELRVNGQPLPDGVQKLAVEGRATRRVSFGKPGPAQKPPALAELPGPLQVRVFTGKEDLRDEAEVMVRPPREYVDVPRIRFFPGEGRLEVLVRANRETFSGAPCRVSLVLKPDRIPALVQGQKKDGTYAGTLAGRGDELLLTARNLRFKPGPYPNGLVYLTIDGYERAYTFRATFTGQTASEPRRIDTPVLRLGAYPYAPPSPKFPVELEVDNTGRGAVTELGFDRNDDKKFDGRQGEVARFPGDRQVRIFFSPLGAGGALVFRTEVQDWGTTLDATEVYNARLLRLRMIRPLKAGEAGGEDVEVLPGGERVQVIPVIDSGKPIQVENGEIVRTRAIFRGVVLDSSPPENVAFLDFPAKLNRGAPLPVRAQGEDPESGIQQAVFFAGKPTPEGKVPPGAVQAPGRPDANRRVWSAVLPVATDRKGTLEVSAQLTNAAGQSTTTTAVIQLVDPPPQAPAGPKAARLPSIEGTVTEGGLSQPNLPVTLRDAQGAARDTVTTNARGQFVFRNVLPGSYRISAEKTADRTRGETVAQVVEGKDKTGVEINLLRR